MFLNFYKKHKTCFFIYGVSIMGNGEVGPNSCKRLKERIALNGRPISQLRDVTCHPTQVNAPRHNPSPQSGTRFTYPGGMEG